MRLPETARLARRALLGGSPEEPKGDEAEWSDDDGDFEYVGQPIARCFDGKTRAGQGHWFFETVGRSSAVARRARATAILKIWNMTRSCKVSEPSPSTPPKLPEKRSATGS